MIGIHLNPQKYKGSWLTITFICITILPIHAQNILGKGLVRVDISEGLTLDFFSALDKKNPAKHIEIEWDYAIDGWGIFDSKNVEVWLLPELLWLENSVLYFTYQNLSKDWIEIVVNKESGTSYWIQKSKAITIVSWEEYLKRMFVVSRGKNAHQEIRNLPSDKADRISYRGVDCFSVRQMKDEWIEIFTAEECMSKYIVEGLKSGWIRWREGDILLIEYLMTK